MKVNASFEDISDGRLYDLNDMVKADTRGCSGCSACCYGVEQTIVLNPYDMYQICVGSGKSYEALLDDKIELHVEDKLTIPNLRMMDGTNRCGFLNDSARCSIHGYRPSICRLFPLGRYYEEDDFYYFFKAGECVMNDLSKVKVKKWIGINNYNENKKFILAWHGFIKALRFRVKFIRDKKELNEVNQYIINEFYKMSSKQGSPIKSDTDFYNAFYQSLIRAKDKLGVL